MTTTTPGASSDAAAEIYESPGSHLAAYLAAVAARLAARGITSTLESIVGTPVLHAEDPADAGTADPGTSPQATADTITAVLSATRPPHIKDTPPSPRDLTALIFQGLYPRYELATVSGIHVVTPRRTPWFAGPSLGAIARAISDYEYQGTLAGRTPRHGHRPGRVTARHPP